MKKKNFKLLGLVAVLVLSIGILSSCGEEKKEESNTIKVGASPAPHAQILKAAEKLLEKEGYKLQVVEFQDYIQPNEALNSGDIDANYFQHVPYLEEFNKQKNMDLVSAGAIHYEPLGLYQGNKTKLSDLKKGDKIAVPNDTSNEARALLLLQANGIIKLKDGVGLTAKKGDIVSNPKGVDIIELDAAIIPRSLKDTAFSVINGNFALSAGLKPEQALGFEKSDSEAAKTYANIIAVRKGDEKNPKIEALIKALKSEEIKKFIDEKYKGAVLTVE